LQDEILAIDSYVLLVNPARDEVFTHVQPKDSFADSFAQCHFAEKIAMKNIRKKSKTPKHKRAKYKYDVFISYSHADMDWVRGELLPRLEKAGVRVMIDFRDFKPGVASLLNMKRAIEDSRYIIFVLTPHWIESEWTVFESRLAYLDDPTGTRRIPLMLKDCHLPAEISTVTYIDFRELSEFEQQMAKLLIRVEPPSRWSAKIIVSVLLLFSLLLMVFAFSLYPRRNQKIKEIVGSFFSSNKAIVSIVVDPPDAEVSIDSMKIESTSLDSLELSPGHHQISISASGYQAMQAQFGLMPGTDTTLTYSLIKIPEPPSKIFGGINITSKPIGASIRLNNQFVGTTPYEDHKIRPGSYKITISLPGYAAFSRTITVRSGKTTEVEAVLNPVGTLTVRVIPFGFINIDKRPRTEKKDEFTTDLPVGKHLLKVVHPDYGAFEKTVEIKADKPLDMLIDFTTKVTLKVTAFDEAGNPVRANIYVDNQDTGEITPTKLALRIGRHVIAVSREGYTLVSKEEVINLEEDREAPLSFILRKKH
jgi:hypothetical protein